MSPKQHPLPYDFFVRVNNDGTMDFGLDGETVTNVGQVTADAVLNGIKVSFVKSPSASAELLAHYEEAMREANGTSPKGTGMPPQAGQYL